MYCWISGGKLWKMYITALYPGPTKMHEAKSHPIRKAYGCLTQLINFPHRRTIQKANRSNQGIYSKYSKRKWTNMTKKCSTQMVSNICKWKSINKYPRNHGKTCNIFDVNSRNKPKYRQTSPNDQNENAISATSQLLKFCPPIQTNFDPHN